MGILISLLLLIAIFGIFFITICSIAYVVEIIIECKVQEDKKDTPVYI